MSVIRHFFLHKLYVVAYKKVNGKQKVIGKSIVAHVVGNKNTVNTNVKSITLKKSSVMLSKGKTYTIKGSVTLVSPKKEMLNETHAAKLRFRISNKKVATVDKTGKITAKGSGTCYVYVYAVNGCAEKVTVTVK